MLRVAVIGVGSMGKNHARVYAELPDAQLVAVADPAQAAADQVARRWGARAYLDYREMLERERLDAVSVAVPITLHEEVATAALRAGVNVLVEKPIAATLEAGRRLIDCARAQRRQLMVGHIVRFNPAMQELKKRLAQGMLGRIFQINCRRIGPFPDRIQEVGVVVDLAPHDIDIMRFLTGMDPVRAYAETEQRLHTAHEDLLLGLLRFPDSVSGSLEINWLTPTKVREVCVLGEQGMFKVDDLTQDLYFYENAQASGNIWSALRVLRGVGEGSMTKFAFPRFEPLKAELQAFLQSVQAGTPPPVSGEDSLMALRVAMALIASSKSHQVETIPPELVVPATA